MGDFQSNSCSSCDHLYAHIESKTCEHGERHRKLASGPISILHRLGGMAACILSGIYLGRACVVGHGGVSGRPMLSQGRP